MVLQCNLGFFKARTLVSGSFKWENQFASSPGPGPAMIELKKTDSSGNGSASIFVADKGEDLRRDSYTKGWIEQGCARRGPPSLSRNLHLQLARRASAILTGDHELCAGRGTKGIVTSAEKLIDPGGVSMIARSNGDPPESEWAGPS